MFKEFKCKMEKNLFDKNKLKKLKEVTDKESVRKRTK